MRGLTKTAAEDAIERMDLGASNRLMAGAWLALWDGDAMPRRDQFDKLRLNPLLPSLIVFDVVPDESVFVQQVGPDITTMAAHDFTGEDWVRHVPIRLRNMRMRNLTAVARGAVMSARRRMIMTTGSDRFNEELVLPLAPDADGLSAVVAHVDWKLDPAMAHGLPLILEHCAREHRVIVFGDKRRADDLPMAAV